MTTRFRIYVQAAGPQFRHILKEEMHSLLSSASPTVKPPSFTDMGNAGVEFSGTLRDIYVLSHGLRSADDMLVQLSKKDRVTSLNKFVQVLQAIPFHAYGDRFTPYVGRKGFKSAAQREEEEKNKAYAERFTLPANTRVLVDRSILSPDRSALKHLAHESIRRMLILRKNQTIKPKKWVYQDDELRAKADAFRNAEVVDETDEIDASKLALEEDSDAEGIDSLDNTLYEPKNSFSTFGMPNRIQPTSKTKIRDETSQKKPDEREHVSSSGLSVKQTTKNSISTEVIPPRPFADPVVSGLTINLQKNHMTVSISAAGQRSNMLFKRGWRNRIIETSMRESIAAAVLHSAYTGMSPMKPDSPLVKLSEPQFVRPIANTLNTLANSITSLPHGFKIDAELQQQLAAKQAAAEIPADDITEETGKTKKANAKAAKELLAKTKKEILAQQESLRTPLLHSRDSTSLSDVVAYTISSGITRSDPSIRIFDPFCGSGTLVIEGVHKFLGLPAPALPRSFAFENWPIHNEPEYNSLIKQWNTTYDSITSSYMETFGALRRKNRTTGEDEITLDNFPLFVGSDLRDKSIRAATHNARMAKVDYFTDFFQSDFEKIINQAGDQWNNYLLNTRRGPASSQTTSFNKSLPSNISVTEAITLDQNGLPTNYFETPLQKSNIVTLDALSKASRVVPLHEKQSEPLPLRFPYLKGYTMFSNVPWGVSDAKPHLMGADKTEFNRGHVNTTQMESVDSVYLRLGRALYHHSHLFRDVFILSAHAKFEKLTMIGAERAEKEALRTYRDPRAVQNALMLPTEQQKPSSSMRWQRVETFYNQGVKTHLLRLEM